MRRSSLLTKLNWAKFLALITRSRAQASSVFRSITGLPLAGRQKQFLHYFTEIYTCTYFPGYTSHPSLNKPRSPVTKIDFSVQRSCLSPGESCSSVAKLIPITSQKSTICERQRCWKSISWILWRDSAKSFAIIEELLILFFYPPKHIYVLVINQLSAVSDARILLFCSTSHWWYSSRFN